MRIYWVMLLLLLKKVASDEKDADKDKEYNTKPRYTFSYGVHDPHSKDIKTHHEERDGKYVSGYYTFMEADGSVRVVRYKVGPESGFEAVVERLLSPFSGGYEAYEGNMDETNRIDDKWELM